MMPGQHTIVARFQPILAGLLALLGLWTTPEIAEASRLDKISGGISNSYETMRQLKAVSLYAGLFFLASSIGLLFGLKQLNLTFMTPLLISLLGAALVIFSSV